MLLDERSLSRPYIERKGLEAVVRDHVKGNRNYTTEIHKVLTLEILHRLFLDSPERGGFCAHGEMSAAPSEDYCGAGVPCRFVGGAGVDPGDESESA
jgi:hypothetical protein